MEPHLVRWDEAYRSQGLVVIEVDNGSIDTREAAAKHVAEKQLSHRFLWDEGGRTTEAYAVTHYPTAYLIGANGRVLWEGDPTRLVWEGEPGTSRAKLDPDFLSEHERRIRAALAAAAAGGDLPEPLAGPPLVATAALDLSSGVPVVAVSSEARGPLHFAVDTSRVASSVGPELARALGVADELRGLRVAGVELPAHAVLVETPADARADGVLGLAAFAPFLTTLDLGLGRLFLQRGALPEADGATVLDYFLCRGQSPAVSVHVADWLIDMHLDSTSALAFALAPEQRADLPLAAEPALFGRARTPAGTVDVLGAQLLSTASIGSYTVARPQLAFSAAFEHARVGRGVLEKLYVTFDQASSRVRFLHNAERKRHLHAAAAAVERIGEGAALRETFESGAGKPRLMMLLSPT